MQEFKVGDRVYWRGSWSNSYKGDSGVITSFRDSESAWVLWDSDGKESWIDLLLLKHEQPKDKPKEHPITFYNIQDDIPIGGFAKVGNEVYKVVNSDANCSNCDFSGEGTCWGIKCKPYQRSSKSHAALILYDTIPEDNNE